MKRAMRAAILMGTVSAGVMSGAVRAAEAPRAERAVLPNGLRVLVVPQPHLPMVVVNALVDAGSRFDTAGKEGLANLTATLLTEGTAKRSAAEIHEMTDFLGARLSAGAGDDYSTLSLTVLRKDLDQGMGLFAEVLLSPAFRAAEVARKRDEAQAELEADDQNPGAVADREFRKALFGAGPYRSGPGGWKESVANLKVTDVKKFYSARYRPENTILVASGDVTMADVSVQIEKLLTGWKRGSDDAPAPKSVPVKGPGIVRIDRDLTQANVVWGHLGTTRDDPDWYAIQVMNYILGGGGFSSRMMESIRTRAGLAYSVFSYFVPGKIPGPFQVVLQTKSATTAEALKRLRSEVERIRSEPVSDAELEAARKYLTGSFPLRFDSNGEMVSFFSQVEYYGLGLDYPARYDSLINSVTKEEILRVARKYLKPEQAILVVVGKQGEIALSEP